MSRRIAAYDAPEFYGRDNRYAHRIYGGVIINTVR